MLHLGVHLGIDARKAQGIEQFEKETVRVLIAA
jgi:hypothetical protein